VRHAGFALGFERFGDVSDRRINIRDCCHSRARTKNADSLKSSNSGRLFGGMANHKIAQAA
jgi:hypothetical protein